MSPHFIDSNLKVTLLIRGRSEPVPRESTFSNHTLSQLPPYQGQAPSTGQGPSTMFLPRLPSPGPGLTRDAQSARLSSSVCPRHTRKPSLHTDSMRVYRVEEEGGGVRKEKNWGRGDWHCRTGERERARAGGGRGWRKTEKECRGRKSEC